MSCNRSNVLLRYRYSIQMPYLILIYNLFAYRKHIRFMNQVTEKNDNDVFAPRWRKCYTFWKIQCLTDNSVIKMRKQDPSSCPGEKCGHSTLPVPLYLPIWWRNSLNLPDNLEFLDYSGLLLRHIQTQSTLPHQHLNDWNWICVHNL